MLTTYSQTDKIQAQIIIWRDNLIFRCINEVYEMSDAYAQGVLYFSLRHGICVCLCRYASICNGICMYAGHAPSGSH